MKIEVNFLKHNDSIKIKREGEKILIFDPIRNEYFVLQPEEHVRQLVVQYLIHEKKFPKTRFKIEKGLKVNTLAKRCDILVYNQNMEPLFLVECKSPKVPISDKTFEQIARYNLPLQVQYLIVTNGLTTYCCKMDYEKRSFTFLDKIPSWEES